MVTGEKGVTLCGLCRPSPLNRTCIQIRRQVPTLGAGATNGAALYDKTFSGDTWAYGNMTYNSTQVRGRQGARVGGVGYFY